MKFATHYSLVLAHFWQISETKTESSVIKFINQMNVECHTNEHHRYY